MLRFRRTRSLQKFVSVHASADNHFNQERHLSTHVFDVSGSFVWQTDVAAKKMLRCAWMAAMRKLRRSIWTVAGSWLWGDSDRCCAMHISTLWAETSPSLQ
jgi:hypothetical protein